MTDPGVKYDAAANYQAMAAENERLRHELAVLRRALADLTEHVWDAAQSAAAAAQLGRMLTDDQGGDDQ